MYIHSEHFNVASFFYSFIFFCLWIVSRSSLAFAHKLSYSYIIIFFREHICCTCAWCSSANITYKCNRNDVRPTLNGSGSSNKTFAGPMERELLTNRTYKGRVCLAIDASSIVSAINWIIASTTTGSCLHFFSFQKKIL